MRVLVNYLKVFAPLIRFAVLLPLAAAALWYAFTSEPLVGAGLLLVVMLAGFASDRAGAWFGHEAKGRKALAKHDFAVAEDEYRRGLDKAARFPDDDPRVAILLDGLGQAVKGLGDYTEAESLAQQALAINERAWGPDHYRTMVTVVNLANIYLELARYDDAALLYRRALERVESRSGPQHRDVAICLNNLGRVFSDRERLVEAETYYRRAYDIVAAKYKPTHFLVAFLSNNMGHVLIRLDRLDEAEPFAERAASTFEGRDDLFEAMALGNLGYLRLKQRRLREAEELVRDGYAICKHKLGTSHPSLVHPLYHLAEVFKAQERWDDAEEVCQRNLHLCENYLVPTHPMLARCLEQYAGLLDTLGRSSEAERLRQRARPVRACFEGQPAFAAKPVPPAEGDWRTGIKHRQALGERGV
jgi:tetratricopeptide (TPR) repeat protein